MSTDDDIDDYCERLAAEDTIAWDAIYAKATARARRSRVAQLILERGPADYQLVDGRNPGALKLGRLRGARVHVILDWA